MNKWIYIVTFFCGMMIYTPVIAGEDNVEPLPLLLTDHPLVDSIFDVNEKQTIDRPGFFKKLNGATYILLGEVHDNISHHRNHASVIDYLSTRYPAKGVAFEMINDSQGKYIRDSQFISADELIDVLNLVVSGWDYEHYYRPVFESVIGAGFTIYPANIDGSRLMEIVRNNADMTDETARILAATGFTPEVEVQMEKDIIESHCDMLNSEQASSMVQAQKIRDATMAASLLKNLPTAGVLIAGNGHVRKDSGVPAYIHAGNNLAVVISVALIEVEKEQDDISAYARNWGGERLPFDYVWFTPRADREDPCIEFIRQHSKNSE